MTTIIAQAQSATDADAFMGVIPSEWMPHAMLAAGIALVTLVMLRSWWKRRRRMAQRDREDAELSPKDRMERMRADARRDDPAGAQLRTLMLETQELTRAASAQLDTKAAKLEALIEEANATIARLHDARSGEHVPPAMRPATGAVTDTQLSSVGFPMQTDRVRTFPQTIERAIDRAPQGLGSDPIADRVMDLSRKGYSPVQIAQELNEQVGRVELMLALRKA
ncbi:MAG: hypothetical protein AAGH64_09145 [Planctomycetota bacterium]